MTATLRDQRAALPTWQQGPYHVNAIGESDDDGNGPTAYLINCHEDDSVDPVLWGDGLLSNHDVAGDAAQQDWMEHVAACLNAAPALEERVALLEAALRRLTAHWRATYGVWHLCAFCEGQMVGDAASFAHADGCPVPLIGG